MIKTIDDALSWIHSKRANGRRPSQLRMLWLLEQVSNPHLNFPAIHIVGTNGKGSTLAFLRSIFSEAGYKVGSFSSPFITVFNERIAINAENISDTDLIKLCQIAYPIIENTQFIQRFVTITEFELVTYLMFIYFGKINPVDIAIIEAGVGGEKDATAVLNQIALILTSIGEDHQDVLGNQLEEITATKVKACQKGNPIYLNLEDESLLTVAKQIAKNGSNPLINLRQETTIMENVTSFSIHYKTILLDNLKIKLLGEHQINNASLAVCAAIDLAQTFPKLSEQAIRNGLANAYWPGRTEWLNHNLLIDGAHNRQGMIALTKLLKKQFPDKEIEVLFAGLKTKDLNVLDELKDFNLFVTTFPFPNARPVDDYDAHYPSFKNFEEWFETQYSSDSNKLFVVTGSLYFISYVRDYYYENKNQLKR